MGTDATDDGIVDAAVGESIDDSDYNADADINRDGVINSTDAALIAPSRYATRLANGDLSGFGNTIGFSGYLYNPVLRVYTVRFRHYDVAFGRWLERDPAGYVDGASLYTYSDGGPLLMSDPFGLGKFPHSVPGYMNGQPGTYTHYYDSGWIGLRHDYLYSTFSPTIARASGANPFIENAIAGAEAHTRDTIHQLSVAASRAGDVGEITLATSTAVIILLIPGPDDAVILAVTLARGTRYLRIGKSWFEELATGERVAVKNKKAWNDIADGLGYKPTKDYPFDSHGQPVYKRGGKYITPDWDLHTTHQGELWKVYDRNGNRLGTFTGDLSECIRN